MSTPQTPETLDSAPETASTGPASADSASTAPASAEVSPLGRIFAIVAFVEAFTWAGLLVGMFLKYVTGTTEAGVWLFGRLHGGAFMLYVVLALLSAWKLRWQWWVALVALAAAIPPLVTVPLEMWLRRTGRLGRRG
ncbi:DUF3817 domain-containing protein [Brachybacterium phenoliresistens]|uniref:Membrane protein n=1 Tax=Brachybacterium phenoliresistens TaxID=396014 RepID=Z9JPM4_9MICO|nr:membrane protein [Brachybacterium phenoliresistens]